MKNIKQITNEKLNIMYSRVSSVSQEHNTSLHYQQSNLMSFCTDNKILNNIHITDVDSGAKERKGIVEIKHLISLGLIDTIYITKLDRLYRSIVQGSSFIQLCLDNSVNIKTTLENTDTSTSAGMLQIHLLLIELGVVKYQHLKVVKDVKVILHSVILNLKMGLC